MQKKPGSGTAYDDDCLGGIYHLSSSRLHYHCFTLLAVVVCRIFVVSVAEGGKGMKIIVVRPTKFWGRILKSIFKV